MEVNIFLFFADTRPQSDDDFCGRIPRIQGQSDITFQAEAIRTSSTHQKAWSRPPIAVDFQVLMLTASGLLVRFLKVFEKNNYNSVKWVRYLTKSNGTYQIRVRIRLKGIRNRADTLLQF